VMLMVPGLALFYGGMVRAKSALNMLMMSISCLAVITVVWVLYGYSLAFGPDAFGGLIGTFRHAGMAGVSINGLTGSIPTLVFASFQLMFAAITTALLSGSIADRTKFGSWLVFVVAWSTVVYFPVAHWVFYSAAGHGGWIVDHLHAIDLAGGTVVEVNSGASGLALALVLGPRLGFKRDPMRPHSLPLVVLGAGLLWFGWFGFNAGSALASGGLAEPRSSTPRSQVRPEYWVGSPSRSGGTGTRRRWVPRPVRSPVSSASHLRVVRSAPSARWPLGSSRALRRVTPSA
jgi:ammonium transporter, Amt family